MITLWTTISCKIVDISDTDTRFAFLIIVDNSLLCGYNEILFSAYL